MKACAPAAGRLLLVLGTLAISACGDDDTDPEQVVLPSVVPSDLAADVTKFEFNEAPDAGSFTILGASGETPFGSTDAVVELVWRVDSAEIDDNATVRNGKPANVAEVSVPGGRSASVTWIEDADARVTVRSRTLDAAQLRDVVEALTIDRHEIAIRDDPFGLVVVGVVPLPIYDSGYSVTYGDGERYLDVDVHPTSGDEMLLYEWGPTEPTTIEGREVLRLLADEGAVPGYVFEYGRRMIVRIEGTVTDAELRAAVASVRAVSENALASIPTEP